MLLIDTISFDSGLLHPKDALKYDVSQKKGFSLVELLVAMFVIGIVTMALSTNAGSITFINTSAKSVTDVNQIALAKIEQLRSQSFSALNDGTINFTSELPGTLGQPKNASYTISTVSTTLKKVTLQITYTDRGSLKSYPFATFIGKSGLAQ